MHALIWTLLVQAGTSLIVIDDNIPEGRPQKLFLQSVNSRVVNKQEIFNLTRAEICVNDDQIVVFG